MAASSGLFLATIYNQSQLAERKHVVARSTLLVDQHCGNGCSITRAPPPFVITTKLAAAILVVPLFRGGALPAQYYPCGCDHRGSTGPAEPSNEQQQLPIWPPIGCRLSLIKIDRNLPSRWRWRGAYRSLHDMIHRE